MTERNTWESEQEDLEFMPALVYITCLLAWSTYEALFQKNNEPNQMKI